MSNYAMPEETRTSLPPIVKRERIGDAFKLAIVKHEQRDKMKKDDRTGEWVKVLKANNKPRQELVVTGLVMPGTTCRAGLGDHTAVPEVGDTVRLILGGAAFGEWIEARKTHRNGGAMHFGDVVKCKLSFAQEWNIDGTKRGGELTTQEEVEAVYAERRKASIGIYGKLQLAEGEGDWPAKCKAVFDQASATPIPDAGGKWDEEEF